MEKEFEKEISSLPIEEWFQKVVPIKIRKYPYVMVYKTDEGKNETCGYHTLEAIINDYYESQEESNGWEVVGIYKGNKLLKMRIKTKIEINEKE